jgi:hypothetical protein
MTPFANTSLAKKPLVGMLTAKIPSAKKPLMAMILLAGMLTAMAWPSPGWSHPGKLDRYGGHFNEKTDTYHYHRPSGLMSKRKKDFLNWSERGRAGELKGKIVKIERPDALWLRVPHRPSYQDMSRQLSSGNRSNKDQLIKIWFLYVSPEASVNKGRKYNAWFRKKVVYELGQKLIGKDVLTRFKIVQQGERMYAMVFMGEENINLWLVLNGWSYYLLNQGENPYHKDFVRAENLARERKAGLWRSTR